MDYTPRYSVRMKPPVVSRKFLKIGCLPLLLVMMLTSCMSLTRTTMLEVTPDNSYMLIVHEVRGDGHSDQSVQYEAVDWKLFVGATSEVTSPAYTLLAEQATDIFGLLLKLALL